MSAPSKKKIVAIIIIAIIGIGGFVWMKFYRTVELPVAELPAAKTGEPIYKVIGTSVEGRKIESYTYGSGLKNLTFVGGIHGGYEWNSVLLAYQFMDYLSANPDLIPENLSVTVIPSANPDGVYKIVGKEGRFTTTDVVESTVPGLGRFNENGVDLNRNFDCKWQPESMWRGNVVSAGTSAFSEPESQAIRNFALENKPRAVIFWHSQSNAVYASACESGILPETAAIQSAYAVASGYTPYETFDSYSITGDSTDWLASINIPAITVELSTHETIEWEKNLAGIKALFDYYR